MTQQANFVQEGVDRVRETVASLESDFEKLQKRVRKRIQARSKTIEKQTQKRVKKLRSEFQKNAYVKRAQGAIDDATRQFEQGVDSVLEVLNVASKRDVGRIDRKLNQINRKLREIEKSGKDDGPARVSKSDGAAKVS
jgi:hypothetical protein